MKRRLASGDYGVIEDRESKRLKSDVWNHFDKVHDENGERIDFVQCKNCKAVLSYSSRKTGTSTLARHTTRCEGSDESGLPLPGPDQPSVATFFTARPKVMPLTQKVKQNVTKKCVYFCCKDIRPFNIVNGDGFVELAQELIYVGATYGNVAVSSVMPCNVTISNRCGDMAQERRDDLSLTLQSLLDDGTVAMTTDMWTCDYRKISYLTITCHFITEEMKLVTKTLSTTAFPLDEAKTGENIRREIVNKLMTKYGLEASSLNKIVWVTDQGANIVLALRPYHRLDCIDHVLNTVLRHGLDMKELDKTAPDIVATLTAAKELVRYVKQTGLAAQLSKTLLQMCDTRFSTVYHTLISIQAIYDELHEKLDARGESERVETIAPDTLNFLVGLLKPFYDAQKELEGDKYPTLNLVCLWHEKLKTHTRPNAADSRQQAVVRKRLKEWLARKVKIDDRHKHATFLWPIFNQLRMMASFERDDVYENIRTLLRAMPTRPTRPDGEAAATASGATGRDEVPQNAVNVFAEWENEQRAENEGDVDEVIMI